MLKSILSALAIGIVAAAGAPLLSSSAAAADLPIPVKARAAHLCGGPCGCLHVSWEHHRELRSTYGIAFDPRNDDLTEPHYYFGPVRAYPRYWVAAE